MLDVYKDVIMSVRKVIGPLSDRTGTKSESSDDESEWNARYFVEEWLNLCLSE